MKLNKIFLWLFLQNKRLFLKIGFVSLLICIPITVFSVGNLMKEKSGIYKIALCSQDKECETAKEITDSLMNSDTVLMFVECENEKKAREMTEKGQCDAAWIIFADVDERIEKYCNVDSEDPPPLVHIIEREQTVSSMLSHEKLHAAFFPKLTYQMYKDFIEEKIFEKGTNEDKIKNEYEKANINDSLLEFSYLESRGEKNDGNFISDPLRGLTAICIILCGLSSQLYYINDRKNGIYDRISVGKHIFVDLGISFLSVFDATLAGMISLILSGNALPFKYELPAVLCFIPCAALFCTLIGSLFSSHKSLGVCIPFITLSLLALSPIFYDSIFPQWIQCLFPPYYYINSAYAGSYSLLSLVYSSVILAVLISGNAIKTGMLKKSVF